MLACIQVKALTPNDDVLTAMALMVKYDIRNVPVVSQGQYHWEGPTLIGWSKHDIRNVPVVSPGHISGKTVNPAKPKDLARG